MSLMLGPSILFIFPEMVHSDAQPKHSLLPTPYLCVTRTYPILSPFLSPAPPRHEYILNGTWRRH